MTIFVAVDNYSSSPVQYLRQQRLLLEMEYNCEKEEFRRQAEAAGLQRKVKRGDAWMPVSVGKSYYNSLNQLAVEVFRTQDKEIEHNFEFGRPVVFFEQKAAPSRPPRGEELGLPCQSVPSPRGGREGASESWEGAFFASKNTTGRPNSKLCSISLSCVRITSTASWLSEL